MTQKKQQKFSKNNDTPEAIGTETENNSTTKKPALSAVAEIPNADLNAGQKPEEKTGDKASTKPDVKSDSLSQTKVETNVNAEIKSDSDKKAKTNAPLEKTSNTSADAKTATQPPLATLDLHEPKKSGSGLAVLALLIGLAGAGGAGYLYQELTKLKAAQASMDQTTAINTANQANQNVTRLESSLQNLQAELAKKTDDKGQTALNQLKTLEQTINSFQGEVKNTQQNLRNEFKQLAQASTNPEGQKKLIDDAVNARLSEFSELLGKVQQLENEQQSITKSMAEAEAARQMLSSENIARQEIGYLLRVANYKLQLDGDIAGAIKLLKEAEIRDLALHPTADNPFLNALRDNIKTLEGLSKADLSYLLDTINTISNEVNTLNAKKVDTSPLLVSAKPDGSFLSKVAYTLASGIKYTPKKTDEVSVSAETALLEKHLIQADLRQAALALRLHDATLFATQLKSISARLDTYFVADDALKKIKALLDTLSKAQTELAKPAPNLDALIALLTRESTAL